MEELEEQIIDGQLHDVQLLNLIPQATLAVDRNRIAQSLLDCMSSRFETLLSEPVYLACHALDHKNWPLLTDRQALMQYGREDVRVIFKHVSTVLTNVGCDLVNAFSQWNDLNCHVSSSARYTGLHPLLVWQMVSQADQDKGDFKDILKIIHLTSVLPLSNATCERAFSTMKRIK